MSGYRAWIRAVVHDYPGDRGYLSVRYGVDQPNGEEWFGGLNNYPLIPKTMGANLKQLFETAYAKLDKKPHIEAEGLGTLAKWSGLKKLEAKKIQNAALHALCDISDQDVAQEEAKEKKAHP